MVLKILNVFIMVLEVFAKILKVLCVVFGGLEKNFKSLSERILKSLLLLLFYFIFVALVLVTAGF